MVNAKRNTIRIYKKMVKYQLEFTEFPRFCQELIGNLHGSNDFSDIALMGDDNRQFKAHKLVLRAHSNVIRDVLSSTDVEKPLLYLKGFNSHDIQCLLDFMYLGETSCEPKNVNVFLKTGKFLQIRQLVEECEDDLETLHTGTVFFRGDQTNGNIPTGE